MAGAGSGAGGPGEAGEDRPLGYDPRKRLTKRQRAYFKKAGYEHLLGNDGSGDEILAQLPDRVWPTITRLNLTHAPIETLEAKTRHDRG